MILKKFTVGPLSTNCYVFADKDTKEAVVIDPGGEPAAIKDFISKNHLKVKYVINTHGHGDHIAANSHFPEAQVLIHKEDAAFLVDPVLNLSSSFGTAVSVPAAAKLLSDGDKIKVGKLTLEVIHTPGHTPGGIALKYDSMLFSGDTLFFESIGRADIPNASLDKLLYSIKNKLMALEDDCKVYPGHGPETTIGHERRHNPFIRFLKNERID